MRNFFLVLIIILCFGCAKPPTAEEMASWDYGPYPDNYEEIIKQNMVKVLIDPYSAQYHFQGAPEKKWMASPFGETKYGWGGVVFVNAKNRLGGYVGAQEFAYIIKNGQLIEFEENFRTE